MDRRHFGTRYANANSKVTWTTPASVSIATSAYGHEKIDSTHCSPFIVMDEPGKVTRNKRNSELVKNSRL